MFHHIYMNESGQLTESECTTTRRIALIRIHVKHAMKRIKSYLILHEIPRTACIITLIRYFLFAVY